MNLKSEEELLELIDIDGTVRMSSRRRRSSFGLSSSNIQIESSRRSSDGVTSIDISAPDVETDWSTLHLLDYDKHSVIDKSS